MCQQNPNWTILKILNTPMDFVPEVCGRASFVSVWNRVIYSCEAGFWKEVSHSQEGDSKISKCFWLSPWDIFWNRFWVSNTPLFKWKYKSTFLNQMHTCDFYIFCYLGINLFHNHQKWPLVSVHKGIHIHKQGGKTCIFHLLLHLNQFI